MRDDRLKRTDNVLVRDWADKCALYRYRCAHCGKETRNPDKGHMDPNKGAGIDNLIPLCPECNNWASDDVIFGTDGRIVAVLSERFLKAAPPEVLRRIRAWLGGQGL
ncbi:MAG TPA: hypothetical protein DDX54_05795 [Rhodospirillaceae bacterium]|nr:HNH endonuclease [Alphaproteobacteria bacterium]HBH26896.1 hypothetical protein [Rhodospirillaceae bacterium]